VVLPLIEESVVPVASKNTKSGEIPTSRTALALSVNGPLVPEQDKPIGGLTGPRTGALTARVADWVTLPPLATELIVTVGFMEVTFAGMFEPVIPGDGPHADNTAADAHTSSKCKLRAKTSRCIRQCNERNGAVDANRNASRRLVFSHRGRVSPK
jgi:hypothetical protein